MSKRSAASDVEKDLLQISANDLIPKLQANPDLMSVKQAAFGFYNKEGKEEFQIQVIVTRHVDDFLDDFQTEEMHHY